MSAATRLVLLPGLDGTGALFARLVEALPADLYPVVVAYPNENPISLEEHVDAVAAAVGGEPCAVLAESFSGLVATTYLATRPHAVESVMFCNALLRAPLAPLVRLLTHAPGAGALGRIATRAAPSVLAGRGAPSDLVSALFAATASVPNRVLLHRMRLLYDGLPDAVDSIGVPCRYIHARHDRLVGRRERRAFASVYADFTAHEVAGPHLLLQSSPRESADLVAALLRARVP